MTGGRERGGRERGKNIGAGGGIIGLHKGKP